MMIFFLSKVDFKVFFKVVYWWEVIAKRIDRIEYNRIEPNPCLETRLLLKRTSAYCRVSPHKSLCSQNVSKSPLSRRSAHISFLVTHEHNNRIHVTVGSAAVGTRMGVWCCVANVTRGINFAMCCSLWKSSQLANVHDK